MATFSRCAPFNLPLPLHCHFPHHQHPADKRPALDWIICLCKRNLANIQSNHLKCGRWGLNYLQACYCRSPVRTHVSPAAGSLPVATNVAAVFVLLLCCRCCCRVLPPGWRHLFSCNYDELRPFSSQVNYPVSSDSMGQAGHFRHFQWGWAKSRRHLLLLLLPLLLLHFPSYLFLVLEGRERKAPLNRFYIKNIAQAIIVGVAARINGS